MRTVLLILLLAMLVLGASIGYFNAQTVTFNYLIGQVELPLIAILIADFLFGVVLTLVLVSARMLRARTEVGRLRRQLRDAESEMRSLRAISAGSPADPTR